MVRRGCGGSWSAVGGVAPLGGGRGVLADSAA